MAGRIRSIKPEILDDEVTAGLSDLEYRIFTGTWLIADDYGNLRADPDYIRSQIVWKRRDTTTEHVAAALRELIAQELLHPYEVRGQSYLHIVGWSKHQKVDKPGKPRMPGPSDSSPPAPPPIDDSRGSRESVANPSRESRETPETDLRPPTGSDDQELEGEPRARARSHTQGELPDGWAPEPHAENMHAQLEAEARGVVVEYELKKFREHHRGKTNLDWGSRWRGWLLKAFPTPQPVREAMTSVDRAKRAQAARDRERTELRVLRAPVQLTPEEREERDRLVQKLKTTNNPESVAAELRDRETG